MPPTHALRYCDDWHSSGKFLLNAVASGVIIDVISDPCYERPLHAAHHLLPANADTSTERAVSPAYSSDLSGEFLPCAEQLAKGRVPDSDFGSDAGVNDNSDPNLSYSPITPTIDPEPEMCST